MSLLEMRGIVPSLNTPFDADGEVDLAAVGALVEETVASGAAGILAIAVAGEHASLSDAEKARIARRVCEVAAGRVPVFISVTAAEPETSVALAAMARAAGADGICCQRPADLGDLVRIADAGPDMLMIQDLDWTGSGMSVETIVELFETLPTFRSLKIETVDPGPKYGAVIEATGGELHVAGGWAIRTMPDALERGVHAFMPTTMDRIYVAIYDAFRRGDRERAWGIFGRLLPVLEFSNQHIDVSIRFFKMMRHAEGMFATDLCREPVRELTPAERAEARKHIAYVAQLTREIAR